MSAIIICLYNNGPNLSSQNGIFIEPENVEYLPEGGVQQLDGDHIPQKDMFGGANYFDRETQFMHLVRLHSCLLP